MKPDPTPPRALRSLALCGLAATLTAGGCTSPYQNYHQNLLTGPQGYVETQTGPETYKIAYVPCEKKRIFRTPEAYPWLRCAELAIEKEKKYFLVERETVDYWAIRDTERVLYLNTICVRLLDEDKSGAEEAAPLVESARRDGVRFRRFRPFESKEGFPLLPGKGYVHLRPVGLSELNHRNVTRWMAFPFHAPTSSAEKHYFFVCNPGHNNVYVENEWCPATVSEDSVTPITVTKAASPTGGHMEFVKDKAVVYGYRMEPAIPMRINRYPK